jgi:hypothetical protein
MNYFSLKTKFTIFRETRIMLIANCDDEIACLANGEWRVGKTDETSNDE